MPLPKTGLPMVQILSSVSHFSSEQRRWITVALNPPELVFVEASLQRPLYTPVYYTRLPVPPVPPAQQCLAATTAQTHLAPPPRAMLPVVNSLNLLVSMSSPMNGG